MTSRGMMGLRVHVAVVAHAFVIFLSSRRLATACWGFSHHHHRAFFSSSSISMVANNEVPSNTGTANSVGTVSSRSIPKAETDVLDLWRRQPTADGRGIKIAILDTGCDLQAAGMQVTTDKGLPKYLDFLDCTGGGDVDIRHTVELNATKTTIQGLSGRNLTLGSWAANLTQIRLGAVRLYRLLPKSVQTRLQKERKELFVRQHQALLAQTQETLDELQLQIDATKNADDKEQLVRQRRDTQTLLEQYEAVLEEKSNQESDAGPYMDIVVFEQSPNQHRAIIDLQANGNLTDDAVTIMAPFGHSRQVGELGFGSAVTFCIQFYNNGRTLSIVTDAGSHGTHVAGIAAAHFPSNNNNTNNNQNQSASVLQDRNGVAPGAQILACKIGDGRLGSAETGKGLVRALIAAKKYGCDLINLSYGEPSWQPNSGRVAETFADAVHKWGMTVFTSAGNDGPALSSLGAPGTSSDPITVGAFVSPDMMWDQYSTLPSADEEEAPLRDTSYHFSSRGPTPDGHLPDLCAPGGAIAPIPRHALQGKAQFHGTSMASPNACGVAACVLSALKQQGLSDCNPTELRRGLVNSAKPVDIPDHFAQGRGLISATGATDYILEHHGKSGQNVAFDVRLPTRNNARGIYIRDLQDLEGPMTFNVNVKPHFDHAVERTPSEMDQLLSFELDIQLVPSEDWVTCPERMTLFAAQGSGGQAFAVRLSGIQRLPPGAHYATVDAIDANDPSRGPLFQVPITVIVPHSLGLAASGGNAQLQLNAEESITLQDNGIDFTTTYRLLPGKPNRRFITVPSHAEWATFIVKSLSPDATEVSPQRIVLHAIPFVRGDLPNRHIQLKKLMVLTERVEKTFHMKVKGGSTLELCLQLLWLANPAPASAVVDIEFHSLNARAPTLMSSQPLFIPPAQGFARFGASAVLRSETLKPKAKLTSVHRVISPSSYDIVAGSKDQDVLPQSDAESKEDMDDGTVSGKQIYDMVLKYDFEISDDVKVVPSIPSLFHQLYDSPLDSQLWELRDSNSQILGHGGAMHHSPAIALTKGDYTLTFCTRHPSRQVLEEMKEVPLRLAFSLSDKAALECKIYTQLDKASTPAVTKDGRKAVGSTVLRKGSHTDLYVARPMGKLPSWCTPGDVLTGSLVLNDDVKDASSIVLSYAVPPKSNIKKLNDNALPQENGNDKSLDEVIFESKINYLTKLRKKDASLYCELAEELKKENSTHIPLLLELLAFASEANKTDNAKESRLENVQQAVNSFFVSNGGPIDESALAQYYGFATPTEEELNDNKEAKSLKKQMDEQKQAVQTCLLTLSNVLAELADSDSSYLDEFNSSYKHMNRWIASAADLSNAKDKLAFALVKSRHERLCQSMDGSAISTLLAAKKDLGSDASLHKEIAQELLVVYRSQNNTQHLVDDIENDLHKRFPPKCSN